MAVPSSRDEFKEHVLRMLGKPVIRVNVADEQVEDRIDEALKYYWDYHFDGSEKTYYKYQITQTDKDNKYITLPENIIGVVRIFPVGYSPMSSADMFNIQYQFALNSMHDIAAISLVPYYQTMERLALINELLVGQIPIRYTRHRDRLHLDANWSKFSVGQYIIVEAYEVIDPDEWTDAWGDRWLAKYAAALVKKQWGTNTSKYSGVQLPGGVTFNGEKIYNEAMEDISKLEHEMISSYSMPVMDMVG
jgi:hypothetical protein